MPAEASKQCCSCSAQLTRDKFSRNQWKKTHNQSRCTRCVLKEEIKDSENVTLRYFVPKQTVGKRIIRNPAATKLRRLLELTKAEYFGENPLEIWQKEEIKEMVANDMQIMVLKSPAPLTPDDQPTFETLSIDDVSGFFTNRTNPITSISPRVGSVSGSGALEFLLDDDIGGERGLEGALVELCKEKNGIAIVIEVADTETISEHQKVYYGTAVYASFHPFPYEEMFLEALASRAIEVLKSPDLLKFCASLISVTTYPTETETPVTPYKADRIIHLNWKYPDCIPAQYSNTNKWINRMEKWPGIIDKILTRKNIEKSLQLYSKTDILNSLGYQRGSEEYSNIVNYLKSTFERHFIVTAQVSTTGSQSWMKVARCPKEANEVDYELLDEVETFNKCCTVSSEIEVQSSAYVACGREMVEGPNETDATKGFWALTRDAIGL